VVVLLAGGTGGAKLARGLLDVADELTVIVNTGDDVEIYGAHVSPDPDLVLYRLADRLHPRGWGLAGDSFTEIGPDEWFRLGDEDLAIGRARLRCLQSGGRLTDAVDALRRSLGVRVPVLPMSDEPAPTFVDGVPFQEWMIRLGGAPGAVQLAGGTMTPEV